LLVAALGAWAAGGQAGCARPAALGHAVDSPDVLAQTVLQHLTAGDREGLRALAVSEEEFRLVVWPELPAARPERNLPYSYVWKDLAQKSEASLTELLGRLRGQRLEFVRLEFTGVVTSHPTYEVSRGSRIWVRGQNGEVRSVRAFGSMLRQGSQVKVFSYVVD
jgi:hypothetical protein